MQRIMEGNNLTVKEEVRIGIDQIKEFKSICNLDILTLVIMVAINHMMNLSHKFNMILNWLKVIQKKSFMFLMETL